MAKPHDDSVLSNIAYPLSALLSWGAWPVFAARLAVGLYLGFASSLFHSDVDDRTLQELDIHATLTYTSLTAAIVYQTWTPWAWALPVLAAAYYLIRWRSYDSTYHVAGWTLATLPGLIIQAGTWALVPIALIAGGGLIKATDETVHGPLHAVWHVLTAGAAGSSDYLIITM